MPKIETKEILEQLKETLDEYGYTENESAEDSKDLRTKLLYDVLSFCYKKGGLTGSILDLMKPTSAIEWQPVEIDSENGRHTYVGINSAFVFTASNFPDIDNSKYSVWVRSILFCDNYYWERTLFKGENFSSLEEVKQHIQEWIKTYKEKKELSC